MDSYPTGSRPVLYLIVCSAPPARHIGELVGLLQQAGWMVAVIPTPRAGEWVDINELEIQTGLPVRADYKKPDDPDVLPRADAIAVVPATFNTINKWANGVSDTFALGILNEALGLGLPIVVAPYAKPPLAAHPAFSRSLDFLSDSGVILTPVEGIRPADPTQPFRWSVITDVLPLPRP
jgi:phosphopantothenoylcysteine synthetase/decarboxylase